MNTKPGTRTKTQNRQMHGLAAQCGLSHEDLRDYAAEKTNGRTDSTSELSESEAAEVINHLKQVAPKREKPISELSRRTIQYYRQKSGVKAVPTEPQLSLIKHLAKNRGISDDGLKAICTRTLGHSKPRTSAEAGKIIEGLKAINARDLQHSTNDEMEVAA